MIGISTLIIIVGLGILFVSEQIVSFQSEWDMGGNYKREIDIYPVGSIMMIIGFILGVSCSLLKTKLNYFKV